ncbi:MAG: hypothetical protein V1725_04955 [archaeon]
MGYTLFTTSACANDCKICAAKDIPGLKIANIGRNAKEQKGLENFLKSMEYAEGVWEELGLTSADPLQNLPLMELVDTYYGGRKRIVINPISFLTFELKKPASKITADDTAALYERVRENGLSSATEKRLNYLSSYAQICISDGNLQSPSVEVMEFAKKFFDDFIRPKIANVPIESNTLNGTFDGDTLKKTERGLACVGNVRTLAEKGEYPSDLLAIAQSRREIRECTSGFSETVYFQREDGETYLFYSMCCAAGSTPYTATRSALSLEKMSCMEPSVIRETMEHELDSRKQGALCGILNNVRFDDAQHPPASDVDWWDRKIPFHLYTQAAEELIQDKTGKSVSILENTFTFNAHKACSSCEACYTVGLLLHRAGIKPTEWQAYLETKFPKSDYRHMTVTSDSGTRIVLY